MDIENKLRELQKIPCPGRFELPNGKSILEVQYFIEWKKLYQQESENEYIIFAVTTDGWDLLMNANLNSELIMQKEENDIESIDLTLSELLAAKHVLI